MVVLLSDEQCRHSLVERSPVHVHCGAQWENKTTNALVDLVVLLHTSNSSGECGGAAERDKENSSSRLTT